MARERDKSERKGEIQKPPHASEQSPSLRVLMPEGLTIHVERCMNCHTHSHFTRHNVRGHSPDCAQNCTAGRTSAARCQEEKYASMFESIRREFALSNPDAVVLLNPGPGDA